jgi:pimeloyl-ACP methyl ester carboxylesterase
MGRFESWDGIEIVYEEWGRGDSSPPVLLHHGFIADAASNWVATGVVEALRESGRRVVAPDARGHGRSEKPHDPARYGEDLMARDLSALVGEIGAEEIDLVGYSMGAIVALLFASADDRVRRLVIGGVGSGVMECGGVDRRSVSNEAVIAALEAEDPTRIEDAGALPFRLLADALGSDRIAMAAQARSVYRGGVELGRISAPTLVLAGEDDPLAIRPEALAEVIPEATLSMVEGDHIGALGDPALKPAIVDFLAA